MIKHYVVHRGKGKKQERFVVCDLTGFTRFIQVGDTLHEIKKRRA